MNWSKLVAAAALVLGAVGLSSAAQQPAKAEKTYKFAVIAKLDANPVFKAARTGAVDAAKELGEKNHCKIEIIWQCPTAKEDAQRQAQLIEQFTSQGVDGIAVSCSDAKVLTSAINAAVEKGIPVFTFDSDAPQSKRLANFGLDDVEAGKIVAQQLVKAMGEKGVVAILAGNQNATNLQARVRGVKEELAKHKDIKILDTYYHPETAAEAVAKVKQVQNTNPTITGWAMIGGWPLFTENALDGVYSSAKIVSVDTLPAQLVYVRNQQVQALVGQDCYGWGYESVRMLLDKVHNGKNPKDAINHCKIDIVTKANVEEFTGLWEKWLGEKTKEAKPADTKPADKK
jgi:ribose transport system substrate-binding protein